MYLHKNVKSLEENQFLAVLTCTYKKLPVNLKFNKKTRELGPKDSEYDFKAMCYRRVTNPVTADSIVIPFQLFYIDVHGSVSC